MDVRRIYRLILQKIERTLSDADRKLKMLVNRASQTRILKGKTDRKHP